MRVVSVSLCLLLWFLLYGVLPVFAGTPGLNGYYAMSSLAFSYCLLAGFFFTADSVTTERFEGTLQLLFHAQTSVGDITLGKFLGLALAPVYGLVAVLPFFALPLLDGGLTLESVAATAVALTITIIFSLTAGLLASALAGEEDSAYTRTALLIAAPIVPFGLGVTATLLWSSRRSALGSGGRWLILALGAFASLVSVLAIWTSSNFFIGSPSASWQRSLTNSAGFWPALVHLALCALIYLLAAALFIEANPSRFDDDKTLLRRLHLPLRTRSSQPDPIVSFVSRDARGAIALVLVAIIVELFSETAAYWSRPTPTAPAGVSYVSTMSVSLLLSFTVARLATVTFASLRRNRSFETVLSTPLKLRDLVRASHRIYWRTVCWVILILAVTAAIQYLVTLTATPQQALTSAIFYVVGILTHIASYIAIFWLGSYFALRQRKPGAAVLLTLVFGLGIPDIAFMFLSVGCALILVPLLNQLLFFGTGTGPRSLFLITGIAPQVLTWGIYAGLAIWAKRKLNTFDHDLRWRETL